MQAAWGKLEKGGTQLYVKSYELGVLVLPSLQPDGRKALVAASVAPAAAGPGATVVPLPYSIREPARALQAITRRYIRPRNGYTLLHTMHLTCATCCDAAPVPYKPSDTLWSNDVVDGSDAADRHARWLVSTPRPPLAWSKTEPRELPPTLALSGATLADTIGSHARAQGYRSYAPPDGSFYGAMATGRILAEREARRR